MVRKQENKKTTFLLKGFHWAKLGSFHSNVAQKEESAPLETDAEMSSAVSVNAVNAKDGGDGATQLPAAMDGWGLWMNLFGCPRS